VTSNAASANGRVADFEGDRELRLRGPGFGFLDEIRALVDANDPPAGLHQPREPEAFEAEAAADVEHRYARTGAGLLACEFL
jgi:hypothetical protein